jgi:Cell division protein CrgA
MPKSKGRRKANKRPTPPKKQATHEAAEKGPSPMWYVVLMFGLMALGIAVILANYINIVPGGTDSKWLIGGLAMIGIGFGMTLNYR